MASLPPATALGTIELDRSSAVPLYRQLYESLREAILSGRLLAGTRLPPTRTLAEKLGVSRTTVVSAFDQLVTEGYLEARQGPARSSRSRFQRICCGYAGFPPASSALRPLPWLTTPTKHSRSVAQPSPS